MKKNGGSTFAIYPKGDDQAFKQVNLLIKQGRIDMYAEADYSEGTTTFMWLSNSIRDIAERIYINSLRFSDMYIAYPSLSILFLKRVGKE